MANFHQPMQHRPDVVVREPRRRRRSRFRAAWLAVPAVCLLAAYVLSQVQPSFSFRELMDQFNVHDRMRFRQVAVLGVAVVAVVWSAKIWRNGSSRRLRWARQKPKVTPK
jgi:hypothetical protein